MPDLFYRNAIDGNDMVLVPAGKTIGAQSFRERPRLYGTAGTARTKDEILYPTD